MSKENQIPKSEVLEILKRMKIDLVRVEDLLKGSEGEQIIGIFDGEFMVTEDGKRLQVPPNYASKTKLVVGDKLRLATKGPPYQFKHIEKVERVKVEGTLSKKDGKWVVLCDQGSFWVLPASIDYFQGEIGDKVIAYLPKAFKELKAKWAAVEEVVKGKKKEEKKEEAREVEKREKPKKKEKKAPSRAREKKEEEKRGKEKVEKTEKEKVEGEEKELQEKIKEVELR